MPAVKLNNLLQETNETSIQLFKVSIYSKLTNEQEFFKNSMKEKCKPRILYPAKLSFNYQGYRKKTSFNIQELRECCTYQSFLMNLLEDKLHLSKW